MMLKAIKPFVYLIGAIYFLFIACVGMIILNDGPQNIRTDVNQEFGLLIMLPAVLFFAVFTHNGIRSQSQLEGGEGK